MDKRNALLLTIITIISFIIALIGAAFAFFGSSLDIKNVINVNVNTTTERAIFTASSSGNIDINVQSYMMQERYSDTTNTNTSNDDNIASLLTSTANINVVLQSSKAGEVSTCTYDIVYTWDDVKSGTNFGQNGDKTLSSAQEKYKSNSNINPSKYYVRSDSDNIVDLKELTVEISSKTYTDGDEPVIAEELQEVNIDYFQLTNDKKITLLSNEQIGSDKIDDPNHIIYDITFKFYNLPINQNNLMGKIFSGTISVENVIC